MGNKKLPTEKVLPSQQTCFEIFPKPIEQKGVSLGSLIKGIHQMKTEFKGFEGNPKGKSPFTFEMLFEKSCYRFLSTCPHLTQKTIQNKFKQAWDGCDTLEVDLPDDIFQPNKSIYADVIMAKKDVLPLTFNPNGELMASNEPLASLITLAKTLTKKEAFMVQYLLLPLGPKMQNFRKAMAQNTIEEIKNGAPEELSKVTEQMFKAIGADLNGMLDEVLEGLFEQKIESMGSTKKAIDLNSNNSRGKIDHMLSKNTGDFFKFRIRIFVKAPNPARRSELLYEVYSALKTIEGYNQLRLTRAELIKDQTPFQRQLKSERQLNHWAHLSSKELVTLLAPPNKTILEKNKQIRQMASEETRLSNEFYNGVIPMGITDPLNPRIIYQPTKNLDVFMLPKVLLGPPGSGKTTYLIWYVLGLMKMKHNVFVFDYIKNAELTKEITQALPEDKYEVWDFSEAHFANTFSLSYPEAYWDWKQDDFQVRYDIADRIKDHISMLLEALNAGKSLGLSAPMERTLGAVAKAVFVHKDQTLYQFYQVLLDYDVREAYIKRGIEDRNAQGESILDEDDIYELKRLNETKTVKDPETKETEIVETGETNLRMVEPIANRMYVFFKNNRIKKIAKNEVTDDYSLYRIFEEGKMVMVRIPQSIFSEEVRSSIVSFLTLKIWLVKEAGKFKGIDDETPMPTKENPKRLLKDMYCTHLIYDEVHQIKPTLSFLAIKIKEFRKFRVCPMVTSHNLEDFGRENLQNFESCQPTYMLLTTPHKKSLEYIEDKLRPLDIKDLLKLPRNYSVNVVSSETENYVFIAKSLGKREDAIEYYLNGGVLKMPSLADYTLDDIDEDDEWEYETTKKWSFKNPLGGLASKLSKPTFDRMLTPKSNCSNAKNQEMANDTSEETNELTMEVLDAKGRQLLLTTTHSPSTPSTVTPSTSTTLSLHSTSPQSSSTPQPKRPPRKALSPLLPIPTQQKKTEKIEKKEEKTVINSTHSHILYQEEKKVVSEKGITTKKKGGSFMNQKDLLQSLVSSAMKEVAQDNLFSKEEKALLMNAASETEVKDLIQESAKVFDQALSSLLSGEITKESSENVLQNLTQMMEQLSTKQKEMALATNNEELIQKVNHLCDSQLEGIVPFETVEHSKITHLNHKKADLTWVGFDESTKIKKVLVATPHKPASPVRS